MLLFNLARWRLAAAPGVPPKGGSLRWQETAAR